MSTPIFTFNCCALAALQTNATAFTLAIDYHGNITNVADGATLESWVHAARRILKSGGALTLIWRADGIADWRYCVTGNDENDFEVPGTHIGLAFNAAAYGIIAQRLARATSDCRSSRH